MEDGVLLRIYIAETARIHDLPGYRYLMGYFLKKGFPGCTVHRAMAGFGHEHRIKTLDMMHLSLDLPLVIDVVDTRERIMAVVPEIEELVEYGLVTVQDVQMSRKRAVKE